MLYMVQSPQSTPVWLYLSMNVNVAALYDTYRNWKEHVWPVQY